MQETKPQSSWQQTVRNSQRHRWYFLVGWSLLQIDKIRQPWKFILGIALGLLVGWTLLKAITGVA